MKYFNNTELARIYKVSEKSVRNWIQSSLEGKLELQLYTQNDRSYVANTTKNNAFIEQLVRKGKKYKNTRGVKALTPKDEFYKYYGQRQILDIISNLTIHKEIPIQYGYINGGANSWDHYANRLAAEKTPNILTSTIELIDMTAVNVDGQLAEYHTVNVIDLGPGNGLPVRSTLQRLLDQGRLGRYIAIDISQEMLDILEENIQAWFGGKVSFEGHVRDLSYERFNDLLVPEYGSDLAHASANLVYFLGGTLCNFRLPDQVLRAVNSSLGPNDLLVYSGMLDTPRTRRYFDFSRSNAKAHENSEIVPYFWQIDDLCDVEPTFQEDMHSRLKRMRPTVDISLEFEIDGKMQQIELRKSEPITVWRHRHYTFSQLVNLFDQNDFDLLQATKSSEQDHLLLMAKIKSHINEG